MESSPLSIQSSLLFERGYWPGQSFGLPLLGCARVLRQDGTADLRTCPHMRCISQKIAKSCS